MPEREDFFQQAVSTPADCFERTLEDALRAFADDGVRPVDAVEFTARVAGRVRARQPWFGLSMPRLAWVLLLVALLVALLASFVYVGSRPREDPTSTGWSAVVFPEADGISDIVPMPRGYLAVGSADHTADGLNAAAWTSSDCLHWQRVAHQAAFHGGAMQCFAVEGSRRCANGLQAESVARLGDRYLAVGWGSLWLSTDGERWERVTPEVIPGDGTPAMRAGTMDVHRVTVIADRFVAVGGDQESFGLWSSGDGRTWQPAMFDTPLAVPTGLGWGGMLPVRGLTVAGTRVMATGPMGTGIWSSSDGVHWAQAFGDEQAAGLMLTDVAASPDGTVVAIGEGPLRGESRPPAVWRSGDGVAWSRVSGPEAFTSSSPATDATLESIAWADGVFLVVRGEPLSAGSDEAGTTRPAVWSSADGTNWVREPAEPAFEHASVDRFMGCGDHVIVTGSADGVEGVAAWARPAGAFEGPSATQVPGPSPPSTTAGVP